MINFIKKYIIQLIFYFLSLIKIYIYSATRKIKIKKLTNFSKKKHSFILVFASYSELLEESSKQLLRRFRNGGGYIVFVSNYLNHKIYLDKNTPIDVFINSNGLGRDFGPFKIATNYISEKIGKNIPEKVIYTNDSVFYVGGSRGNIFLDDLLNSEFDYVGLFENSGDDLIAKKWFVSTWYFSVSKTFFLSKVYQKFFKTYTPHNLKFHAVLIGEVGLSQVALNFSSRLKVIFNNELLINLAKKFVNKHGVDEFMKYMPSPFKRNYWLENKINNSNLVISYLEQNLYLYSPTHIFNIFLLYQKKFFYVKKDLFYSGHYEYNHFNLLEKSLFFINWRQKLELIRSLRIKGMPGDYSIYKIIKTKLELE